jgi:hypothetical protein
MTEFNNLQNQLDSIKERNLRVEADKAWETSGTRMALIAATTYVIAAILLWRIGVQNYFLSAIVPVAGYLLSTLSFPWVKRWWIQRYIVTRAPQHSPGTEENKVL